jgi:hypothetical protein
MSFLKQLFEITTKRTTTEQKLDRPNHENIVTTKYGSQIYCCSSENMEQSHLQQA